MFIGMLLWLGMGFCLTLIGGFLLILGHSFTETEYWVMITLLPLTLIIGALMGPLALGGLVEVIYTNYKISWNND